MSKVVGIEIRLIPRSCEEIGHASKDCTQARKARPTKPLIDWSHHPEMSSEEAWQLLKNVDSGRDLDEIKEAFEVYAKNTPEATFQSIEQKLREEGCLTHLVGLRKDLPQNMTNIDLQTVIDKEFAIGFQLSRRTRRSKMNEGMMAETYEENFERLGNCGYTVRSPIPVCFHVRAFSFQGLSCADNLVSAEGSYRQKLSRVPSRLRRSRHVPYCQSDLHKLPTRRTSSQELSRTSQDSFSWLSKCS